MHCFVVFAALLLQVGAAPSMLMPGLQGTVDNTDVFCNCIPKSECTLINDVDLESDVVRNPKSCPGDNMVCCPSNKPLDVYSDEYNKICEKANNNQAFPDPRCCGRHVFKSSADPNDRIYKGQISPPEQYPWLVRIYLRKKENSRCTGVLIGARHVLTADHCVYGVTRPGVKIMEIGLGCGENCERRIKFSRTERKTVDEETRIRSDIAILTLDEPAPFNNNIRPICLPNVSAISAKYESSSKAMEYTVSGWGLTEEQQVSKEKRHAVIQHMPHQKCAQLVRDMCGNGTANANICEMTKDGYSMDEGVMCFGSENGSTCVKDSGGPVMQRYQGSSDNRYEAVGVITAYLRAGKKCNEEVDIPNINVGVARHMPWIEKTVVNNFLEIQGQE